MTSQGPEPPGRSPGFIHRVEGGIEIAVKVVPGSSRPGIAGVLGDRLKVRVSEPPEEGKANAAVERLIAGWLGARGARIVAGHGRAEKTVMVPGLSAIPPGALDSALARKK